MKHLILTTLALAAIILLSQAEEREPPIELPAPSSPETIVTKD